MDIQEALGIIFDAIDTINEMRSQEEQVEKTPDVGLAGDGGALDSLALATLILAIERRVSDVAQQEIALLDESELDHDLSRFATPETVAALILEKLAQ